METDRKDDGPGNPGTWPLYLDPYAYWNFIAGRGYAFPVMQERLEYITAMGELWTWQARVTGFSAAAAQVVAPDDMAPKGRDIHSIHHGNPVCRDRGAGRLGEGARVQHYFVCESQAQMAR